MAHALPQDHIKAIDQLRMRLSGVATSIGLLLQELQSPKNDPLLAWPELQRASTRLGDNLSGLAAALNGQRQLFTSLHVYPLPVFPGHTQEGLLQQLVRKKLDVKAEDWIEESERIGREQQSNGEAGTLSEDDLQELWASARETQLDIFTRLGPSWDDVYTIREREAGVKTVVTGLKRDLDEDDDHDSEDEGGDGDDSVGKVDRMDVSDVNVDEDETPVANGLRTSLPPLPLDSMLKYAHGQDVP